MAIDGLPSMNKTAAWLWNAMAEDIDINTLIAAFAAAFSLDPISVERDIVSWLREMADVGLVTGFNDCGKPTV